MTHIAVMKQFPTVDGSNPAPPGMCKTLYLMGYVTNIYTISTGAGFVQSTISFDYPNNWMVKLGIFSGLSCFAGRNHLSPLHN